MPFYRPLRLAMRIVRFVSMLAAYLYIPPLSAFVQATVGHSPPPPLLLRCILSVILALNLPFRCGLAE